MTAKQKAIREAYGEHWDKVKNHVEENGWFNAHQAQYSPPMKDFDDRGNWYRPESLSGIENNNGWIRIESESDLPTEEGQYFVYSKVDWHPFYRIDIFTGRLSNAIHHKTGKLIFTYYQPIENPKPPIY